MFKLMFSTVAIMLVYMLFGFVLCKAKKAVVSHAKTISALLLYILAPAMIINSFLQLEYTKESLMNVIKYFSVTLILQLAFIAFLFLLLYKKFDDAKYRIMTIAGALGNVGFLGMPVITAIFPDNAIVQCYSSINVISMNLIVFTMGSYLITYDKKYASLKTAILNPTTLSIFIALPLFLLKVRFPDMVMNSIGLLAKMVTPLCMFILGMRLSESKLRDVFARGFVYITSVVKLVIFPVVVFLCVHWVPFFDDVFKTTVVVLAMAPSGAVIQSLAELHECEQDLAANAVLLATILSVITIPVMTQILI